MTKIIIFPSGKGGTGKSSVCVNLAAAISQREKTKSKKNCKVLVIDLDMQGAASHHLAKDFNHYSGTIINALEENLSLADIIHCYSDTLHFIPCDTEFASWADFGKRDFTEPLSKLIDKLSEYDFIFFDVPPTFSTYSIAPLILSHYAILPVSALSGEPSIHGIENQIEMVDMAKEEDNPNLSILGIVVTMVGRTNLSKEVVEYMKKTHKKSIFKSMIPHSAKVAECSSIGTTILQRSPSSKAAQAFVALGEEFIRRVNKAEKAKK